MPPSGSGGAQRGRNGRKAEARCGGKGRRRVEWCAIRPRRGSSLADEGEAGHFVESRAEIHDAALVFEGVIAVAVEDRADKINASGLGGIGLYFQIVAGVAGNLHAAALIGEGDIATFGGSTVIDDANVGLLEVGQRSDVDLLYRFAAFAGFGAVAEMKDVRKLVERAAIALAAAEEVGEHAAHFAILAAEEETEVEIRFRLPKESHFQSAGESEGGLFLATKGDFALEAHLRLIRHIRIDIERFIDIECGDEGKWTASRKIYDSMRNLPPYDGTM